jgi:pimeloyl-ACP methyl ester carboxylesterase
VNLLEAIPFAITSAGSVWAQVLVAALGFALGLAVFLVMAVAEWGAWVLVLPNRRLEAAEPAPDLGEPIEVQAPDGVWLAGLWHPAEVPTGRTVLLLHGFAEPVSLRSRVEALTRHGWNVAMLDARGHGRSGGDRSSFGGREAGDLRAWIDALSARVGPPLDCAAWGRSMGAGIIVRTAAEDPRVAALVLESPYVDLEDAVAVILRRYRLPFPRWLARRVARRAASLARVSLTRPRPIDLAPRVRGPALVVHGSDDSLVPPAEARRLAEAFPHSAPVIEVAGAGHTNVIDVGGDALLERIAAFLDEAVARPSAG